LRAWYVNLQAPIQRTSIGFDTADYLLDIDITTGLQWSCKDRDEVEEAWRHGLVAPEILDRMEREGERVICDIGARAWPFDVDNEHWRPNPSWGIPTLSDERDAGLDRPFVPLL
jgi:predicted RNA-binding protein associated with RNAse of E/G family